MKIKIYTFSDKRPDFIKFQKETIAKFLKDDYEYLTSREAIIDTLDINEYLFTKEGEKI